MLAKPSMSGRAIAGDRQRSLGTHRKQSVQLEQDRGGNAEFRPPAPSPPQSGMAGVYGRKRSDKAGKEGYYYGLISDCGLWRGWRLC